MEEKRYRIWVGVAGKPLGVSSFYEFKSLAEAKKDLNWRINGIGKAGFYYRLTKVSSDGNEKTIKYG